MIYGLSSPWYESRIGRSLFFNVLALVLVLTNVLAAVVFGDYFWRETIRGVLLGLVVVTAWYQVFAIARELLASRRKARREELLNGL